VSMASPLLLPDAAPSISLSGGGGGGFASELLCAIGSKLGLVTLPAVARLPSARVIDALRSRPPSHSSPSHSSSHSRADDAFGLRLPVVGAAASAGIQLPAPPAPASAAASTAASTSAAAASGTASPAPPPADSILRTPIADIEYLAHPGLLLVGTNDGCTWLCS
jgi:hypothetical protein